MPRPRKNPEGSGLNVGPSKPASTPEGRENQLIALATDLAEKRLREGTASSAEVVHFLKLGSSENRLKRDILKEERKLVTAKTEALESAKKSEELFERALNAFKEYSGEGGGEEEEDE